MRRIGIGRIHDRETAGHVLAPNELDGVRVTLRRREAHGLRAATASAVSDVRAARAPVADAAYLDRLPRRRFVHQIRLGARADTQSARNPGVDDAVACEGRRAQVLEVLAGRLGGADGELGIGDRSDSSESAHDQLGGAGLDVLQLVVAGIGTDVGQRSFWIDLRIGATGDCKHGKT